MLELLSLIFVLITFVSFVFIGVEVLIKHSNKKQIVYLIIMIIITTILCKSVSKLANSPTEWTTLWKTEIVALKDNSDVQGSFRGGIFISSGIIGEKTYYYCMESTDSGKHMIKIPAENTYIIENNTENPSVKKLRKNWADENVRFLLENLSEQKYIITVPTGTIDTTYKINME